MSSGNDQDFDPYATRRGQRAEPRPVELQATRPQSATAARAQSGYPARPASRPVGPAAADSSDIDRAAGDNLREMVVSCDAAPALLQQFDHAQPEFIAVHDIGTGTSRKLLAGVAQASGLKMKQLVIRRQGYGNTLATLEFLEFVGTQGAALRVYSTDVEADAQTRLGLARVLLAYSRMGVLMVGDLPAQALASAFKPLRDAIVTGPWPNRELLLLPLASSAALASQGSDLGRGTGVTVRTTPAAQRPADAWTFISGAWNRLRTQMAATGKLVPELATPVARPAPSAHPTLPQTSSAKVGRQAATPALEPVPLRPDNAAPPAPGAELSEPVTLALMAHYVEQLCKLNGMLECCVFEAASGRSIAHAGSPSESSGLAAAGASLLAAITRAGHRLGLEAGGPEATITLASRHLVLRTVPRHAHLVLHAVLDKSSANLTLARLQIQRMDELFDSASA
jgi:hypothetical protein